MKLIVALILTLSVCTLKSQWTKSNSEQGLSTYYNIQQVNMQDSTKIFYSAASGNSQGVFYSTDRGNNFKYYTDLTYAWGTIYHLKFLAGDTLLIITSKGIIKQSPNSSDLPEFIVEYTFTDSPIREYSSWTKFWGDSGIVNSKISYVTYDGGNNWKKLNDTPHKYYWGTKLEYIGSSNKMIISNQAEIYSSTDIGRTWSLLYNFYNVTHDPTKQIFDISFINDSIGFFTTRSRIYRTMDGGKNWAQNNYINFGLGYDVPSLKFFDTSVGYIIITNDRHLYKTTDSKTWVEEFTFDNNFELADKFYYFNDSMFFVSNGASIYRRSKLALGIKEPLIATGVKPQITVYPNPATTLITVALSGNIPVFDYEIIDLQGRRIVAGRSENNETTISLLGLQAGIYVLNVKANGFAVQKKIVKTSE